MCTETCQGSDNKSVGFKWRALLGETKKDKKLLFAQELSGFLSELVYLICPLCKTEYLAEP